MGGDRDRDAKHQGRAVSPLRRQSARDEERDRERDRERERERNQQRERERELYRESGYIRKSEREAFERQKAEKEAKLEDRGRGKETRSRDR